MCAERERSTASGRSDPCGTRRQLEAARPNTGAHGRPTLQDFSLSYRNSLRKRDMNVTLRKNSGMMKVKNESAINASRTFEAKKLAVTRINKEGL